MTPTYREFLHTPEPRRVRIGCWAWQVGDGTLVILAEGTTATRWGAYRTRNKYAATCRSAAEVAEEELRAALAEVVATLHDEGIDVVAELDERGRVCVRECCPCADRVQESRQHRRVMQAVCRAVKRPVFWEVA